MIEEIDTARPGILAPSRHRSVKAAIILVSKRHRVSRDYLERTYYRRKARANA